MQCPPSAESELETQNYFRMFSALVRDLPIKLKHALNEQKTNECPLQVMFDSEIIQCRAFNKITDFIRKKLESFQGVLKQKALNYFDSERKSAIMCEVSTAQKQEI